MAIYRSEYKVFSDLIFDTSKQIVELKFNDGSQIHIENFEDRLENEGACLRFSVTGEAESLDTAETTLREKLAEYLDKLSFITHARFEVISPLYVIEWTEGQVERHYLAYQTYDGRYPPAPSLHPDFFGMAGQINPSGERKWVNRALKFYRLGLREKSAQPQHALFWKVLEIIGEEIVVKKPRPMACKACEDDLICKHCNESAMLPSIAREGVGAIFKLVAKDDGEQMFKRHNNVRNNFTHGRELKKNDPHAEDLIDEIHWVCRSMLVGVIYGPNYKVELPQNGTTLNREITMEVHMVMRHEDKTPHPDPKQIALPKIEMLTRFGPLEENLEASK